MALFENSVYPGAPYLVAGVIAIWSLLHTYELPKEPELARGKFMGDSDGVSLLAYDSDTENIT